MNRKCPNCGLPFDKGTAISLLLGLKRRCKQCNAKFQNSSLWTFGLSVVIVFVMIASLGFINLLGVHGFIFAGIVPVILFLIGSYFIPLDRVK